MGVDRTDTENRIDDVMMWSSLAVYAAAWFAIIGFGLKGKWFLAGGTAVVYVAMHVFEITRRGHCYLSADSTAGPVSVLFFSLIVASMWAMGIPPLPGEPLVLAWVFFAMAIMGGHMAALVYSAALEITLSFVYRERIAAEKKIQGDNL